MAGSFEIRPARGPADMAAAARLFHTYASGLDIDLSFQSFAEEVAGLPGKYAPPGGELLLAVSTRTTTPSSATAAVLGCVAVRPLDTIEEAGEGEGVLRRRRCEMKRLYVDPSARGLGVGEALARAAVATAARDLDYDDALLDTLAHMDRAVGLYEKLGFVQIPPYYVSPIPGTRYYRLDLRGDGRGDGTATSTSSGEIDRGWSRLAGLGGDGRFLEEMRM